MTRRALQQQKISSRGISREKNSVRNTASFTMNNAITGGGNLIVIANTEYSTPGVYTFTAPTGTFVDIRGAEGGYAAARISLPGKGGRLVIQLTSTQTFQVVVGGQGGYGVTGGRNAGGGGGYSGIFVNSVAVGNYVGVAGGGGGCATGNPSEDKPGGNGAGNGSGNDGGTYNGTDYGRGATTSAGGAGGTGSTNGEAGSALQGGRGNGPGGLGAGIPGGVGGTNGGGAGSYEPGGSGAGGGGGGGLYGGGGGAGSTWGGGGGGGSGGFNPLYATLVRATSGSKANNGFIGFYTSDPG